MARLRSALTPLRSAYGALTVHGRVVASLAIGSGIAGVPLHWPELLVICATSTLALCVSVVSVMGSGRFSVGRSLHPTRLRAGERSMGLLRIRNDGRTRRKVIRAVDRVGDRELSIDIPPIGAREVVDIPFTVTAERRGVVPVGPLWIGRADPFGLMRRRHAEGKVLFLLVHPRTVTVPVGGAGWAKDVEGPTTHDSPLGSVAFHSLRDYVPGDDRRHIHWRSSARAGHPVVRQFVDTRRSSNLLVLDGCATHYETTQHAETAVEVLASLAVAMVGAGQPTVCELGDGRQLSDRLIPMLDRMARFEFRSTEALAPLVAGAVDGDATPTTVVVVTGSRMSSTDLANVGAACAKAAQVVVVQVGASGVGVNDDRAGHATIRLRTLDEFPQVWGTLGLVRRA